MGVRSANEKARQTGIHFSIRSLRIAPHYKTKALYHHESSLTQSVNIIMADHVMEESTSMKGNNVAKSVTLCSYDLYFKITLTNMRNKQL
jgi:hypothetical protein